MFLPTVSSPLLRVHPSTPPSLPGRLLSACGFLCLWLFYRSGQKPGAVKVWNEVEGEGGGGVERYCKSSLYWETHKRRTALGLPPCDALLTWSMTEMRRRDERRDNKVCTCWVIGSWWPFAQIGFLSNYLFTPVFSNFSPLVEPGSYPPTSQPAHQSVSIAYNWPQLASIECLLP